MSLINLITSGAGYVLQMVKQYVGNPTIVYNGVSVPIQTYRYVPRIEADVSRKVIVDASGKKFVSDNVAPGPHEWHLEGYIGGMPNELSSLYMKSIGIFRDTLDSAFLSRQPLDFYDADQKAWTVATDNPVMITTLEFEMSPDTENRLIVRIDLRELSFLQTQVTSQKPLDTVTAAATPPPGGSSGADLSLGATEGVAEGDAAAPASAWGDEALSLAQGLR